MSSPFGGLLRFNLLVAIVQTLTSSFALTLPPVPSISLSTTPSHSPPPADYPIPNAPAFQLHVWRRGGPLDPSDYINVLALAQTEIFAFSWVDPPDHSMLNGTHTYTYRTVQLSLTPELPLQRKDAALFIAGIMEWGSQYGFTTVGEVMFFNPQGTRLAVAKLDESSAQTATAQTPGPTSLSTSPTLWPLPTVPGFFIRFNTYGHPLRREDSLRALEAADATLIYLYHQAPEGVNPILPGARTWTVGTVSFTITPASQLNVIDATWFALGMMQWGCANGFTETDVEFVRRIGGSRGEMVGFGTGKLSAAGRDVA